MTGLMTLVSGVLLIPYLVWGVYTLRLRYAHHEELDTRTEAITLALVAVFFFVELALLRGTMSGMQGLYAFTALGLVVSGTALYGPMLVSLTSQFLVDMVMPKEVKETDTPQFGPAEALEEVGDYQGALQEYFVIARIFPKNAECTLRVATTLAYLDRSEEAIPWFQRALAGMTDPDRALRVTNRLSEILARECDRPDEAAETLDWYLERFPDTDRAESLRERRDKLRHEAPEAPAPTRAEAQAQETEPIELDPSNLAPLEETDSEPEMPEGDLPELELPELEAPEDRSE